MWGETIDGEPRKKKTSKYLPHQNLGEQARRLKQIRDGRLKGPVVSEGARFMAHGIVPPDMITILKP